MKRFFVFLILAGSALAGSGQIDSLIYGITSYTDGSGLMLARINPLTGEVMNISGSIVPYPISVESRLIDPIHKIFYLPVDSTLLSFDLSSGNLISATPITQYGQSQLQGYCFNCPDTTIYGMARDTNNGDLKLAKIDPLTGMVTAISSSPIGGQQSVLMGTTIDPYSRVFYYVSITNHIMGIDLNTGNVVSDPSIIIPEGKFGPINYNCYDSVLYGLSGSGTAGRKFGKIDPTTGVVTEISSNYIATYIINQLSTIDPFMGIYYFTNDAFKLVGVDIHTGEVVTDPPIIPIAGSNFYDYVYNHSCYVEGPVGIMSKDRPTNISIFPNPTHGKVLVEISGNRPVMNIELFNLWGQRIEYRIQLSGRNTEEIDVGGFDPGIYFLRFHFADQPPLTRKIVLK